MAASNSPETVMASRRVQGPSTKTVNRSLFFYMKFSFYKYDRTTAYSTTNDRANTNYTNDFRGPGSTPIRNNDNVQTANDQFQNKHVADTLKTPLSQVVLPLPPELFEEYNIDFSQSGVGLINKTLLDAATAAQNGNLTNFYNSLVNEESARALVTTARGVAIESLPDGLQSAAEMGFGKIVNPVYQTAFRGVGIRTHNWSWKIAPESPQEQSDIQAVLDELRTSALPPYERSGEINNIMYPRFMTVEIMPPIIKFPAPMFISNLAINHAPEGIPAFFKDKTPIGYEIKMRATETTPVLQQDITTTTSVTGNTSPST